jgi:hypothetical protein
MNVPRDFVESFREFREVLPFVGAQREHSLAEREFVFNRDITVSVIAIAPNNAVIPKDEVTHESAIPPDRRKSTQS